VRTNMSVLLFVVPKCTLDASHAAPGESPGKYADGTDSPTDGRKPDRCITLSHAFSVVSYCFDPPANF